MAIARAGSAAIANIGTGTSVSVAYTCGSGTNRLLLVGFFAGVNFIDGDVTGVTYNSVAMSHLGFACGAGDRAIWVYGLLNPASGSNTLAVTLGTSSVVFLGSADYTGVLQSGLPDGSGQAGQASGTSLSATGLSVTASNCWVFGLARENAGTTVSWTGATELTTGGALHMADSNTTVSTGAYTLTGTVSGASVTAIVGVSFAPDTGGGGGGPVVKSLAALGVG